MSKPIFELLGKDNVPEVINELLPRQKGDLFVAFGAPFNTLKLEQRIIDWCKEHMDGRVKAFVAKVFIDKPFAEAIKPFVTIAGDTKILPGKDKGPITVPVYKFTTGYGMVLFIELP